MQKHTRQSEGKVVLITGGAVRIGRAIARTFAQAGARVAVHCNSSTDEAEELVRELNKSSKDCFWLQADLTNQTEREQLIPAVRERTGALDCLINNASVYRRSPLLEMDESRMTADWRINFMAPFQLMRQFTEEVGKGVVINLLDQRVAGVDPAAGGYGLAKKMLRDATEAAALEWAPRIRVNGVAPGLVLPPPGVDPSQMTSLLQQVPMQKATPLEEVAEACLFLAGTSAVTGQILYLDGGLHLGKQAVTEKNQPPR